jgi:hypothetical protein
VEICHPEKGLIEYKKDVSTTDMTRINRYYRKRNKVDWYYYALPYWKQGKHREYAKMTLLSVSYTTLSTLAYLYEQNVAESRRKFNSSRNAYINASTSWQADVHRQEFKAQHKKLEENLNKQNLVISGLVATYVIGVIDAIFFRPREGYSGPPKFSPEDRTGYSSFIPKASIDLNTRQVGNGMFIGLTWSLQ